MSGRRLWGFRARRSICRAVLEGRNRRLRASRTQRSPCCPTSRWDNLPRSGKQLGSVSRAKVEWPIKDQSDGSCS